jgi:hypothetical protein
VAGDPWSDLEESGEETHGDVNLDSRHLTVRAGISVQGLLGQGRRAADFHVRGGSLISEIKKGLAGALEGTAVGCAGQVGLRTELATRTGPPSTTSCRVVGAAHAVLLPRHPPRRSSTSKPSMRNSRTIERKYSGTLTQVLYVESEAFDLCVAEGDGGAGRGIKVACWACY